MPFHSLLELMIKREREYSKLEGECYKRMKEVDFYLEQIKALGKEQDLPLKEYQPDE